MGPKRKRKKGMPINSKRQESFLNGYFGGNEEDSKLYRLGVAARSLVPPEVKNAAAAVVHRKAFDLHKRMEKRAAALKRGGEKPYRVPRLEPCAVCEWAGVCEKTGATCPVFRFYVNRAGGNPYVKIPDRTWEDSFLLDKDENPKKGHTKKKAPPK